ncbi:sporulation protein YqfD [Paenibacillus sp. J22TS3]|uniref:sporulation protein YqfD n=1 Tax=Paenibacillus sp. J22TS3 TaxID=2807192 RepID=UPI001B20B80B|nr:sporulation protein YqfD [Paenibacillus sp. J22TS3]GIP20533.1 sporulation protein YqfD [Paenibacillus sp. J22TS3]
MKTPGLTKLRGSVKVTVRGERIEIFINELAKERIEVWNLRPLAPDRMEMEIVISDYFRLRPLLKKTSCRVHVDKRAGLPFFWIRIFRRKWFLAGFTLFFLIIFALSSMVWDVEVKGNKKIATEDILLAAREEGIYPFQWIFRLPEQDKLSKDLTRKLKGTSWVGVSKSGTKVTIEVVEAAKPKNTELLSPRHLISKTDAVVTHIFAERGQPEVSKNQRVKKGSVLITGVQGDFQVAAKGEVRGLVWHEYTIEAPLVLRQKVFTGEKKERGYLYFGDTAVQIWGYGKVKYEQSQTLTRLDPLTWREWKLPLGWMSEDVMEVTELETKQSPEMTIQRGLERAKLDILAKNGADARIVQQKILHENTDNGKVYMKVLFEVEQNIAEEFPIVHNQGE